MAVGLVKHSSSSTRTNVRADPLDHHHHTTGTHSRLSRSHSERWWHWRHKKQAPPHTDDCSATSHTNNCGSGSSTKPPRYQRHHTTDSIPSIPEHRPMTLSKRGSSVSTLHDDPPRRKRILLHAIFKC